jgi:hypothetical protein
MERSLPFAPVQPEPPTSPAPIKPPTLEAKMAIPRETPKDRLKRAKEVARALKQFIRENDSQQIVIDGNKYAKREAWQFVAACYQVSPMITSTEPVISDDGAELGFVATAHAIDETGRIVSGAEAACMYSENFWGQKPSFQLSSMAQTRACSKVLCNLFAWVMTIAGLCPTPAEEMDPMFDPSHREITTPCYECGNKVTKKRSLETRRKHGKELCIPCEKKLKAAQGEKLMSPIADPDFVQQSVAQVQERKAAQPIVAAMDAGEPEYA